MSKFPEYDKNAGFPQVHVDGFKNVACNNKMMISSRELNPLCTDLMLEGYAAKGFHIKAKTCDWGPMAGFVPEDYRFTKATQDPEKQKKSIGEAFGHHAECVPLYISDARYHKLIERGLLRTGEAKGESIEVCANAEGAPAFKFVLVRDLRTPPGFNSPAWGVYYHPNTTPELSVGRTVKSGVFLSAEGLKPVCGMTNPLPKAPRSEKDLGAKAAVCGDYDLWCIFEHSTVDSKGIGDRNLPLPGTLVTKKTIHSGGRMDQIMKQVGVENVLDKGPGTWIKQQATAGNLAFNFSSAEADRVKKTDLLNKEDAHLGNVSLAVNKIRKELNQTCDCGGGDVVQHSDYGGNPFGDIDYPVIFFIPDPGSDFATATSEVAKDLGELKKILTQIKKQGYVVKLNPQWGITLF